MNVQYIFEGIPRNVASCDHYYKEKIFSYYYIDMALYNSLQTNMVGRGFHFIIGLMFRWKSILRIYIELSRASLPFPCNS